MGKEKIIELIDQIFNGKSRKIMKEQFLNFCVAEESTCLINNKNIRLEMMFFKERNFAAWNIQKFRRLDSNIK